MSGRVRSLARRAERLLHAILPIPRVPDGGLDDEAAVRTLGAAWQDPDRPPWDVQNTPIEQEKVDLLAPRLGAVESVLDCGCGGGDFFDLVARRAKRKLGLGAGIDVAEGALARARRTGHYDRLVQALLRDAPRHFDRTFDLVILSDVLFYVKDYLGVVRALVPLVAPKGTLFVSLAVGRKYFDEADVGRIRSAVRQGGLELVVEKRLDYAVRGIPRRSVPLHDVFWGQTHKVVLVYERR